MVTIPEIEFSPRARGCSARHPNPCRIDGVFPACAGMFLVDGQKDRKDTSFPRVRGDVPQRGDTLHQQLRFSPRARGCSVHIHGDDNLICVFPACAGMFLVVRRFGLDPPGFPRVRGDVPAWGYYCPLWPWFSPRARGCSLAVMIRPVVSRVFPACAGMFPS